MILNDFDNNSENIVSFLNTYNLLEIDSTEYKYYLNEKIEVLPSVDSLFESTCIDSLFITQVDGSRFIKPVYTGLGVNYLIMKLFREYILIERDCETGYYFVVNDSFNQCPSFGCNNHE